MLDAVDLALIHALSVDGRATSTKLGRVLGVSVQTVQRRYATLQASVGLRVVAAVDPSRRGERQWLVRISASPSGAQGVARAVARRADTSWVRLASGGTEIITVVTTADPGAREPHHLLLRDIPRTAAVTGVLAHRLLHVYRGGATPWAGRLSTLTPSQLAALGPPAERAPRHPRALDADDHRLVDALAVDARLTARALAARTGLSETSAARRTAALVSDGSIYFDVDLDDTAAFGVTDRTFLWLSVPPSDLDETARTLSTHPQLAFVATVTGRSNLAALALTGSPDGLHHYLTGDLARIDAITAFETAPVLQTLKTVR